MRYLFLIFLIPLCAPAFAISECVKLSAATVCSTNADCYNTSDCTVDCAGTNINLIGRCASNSGTADASTLSNLNISSTDSSNIHCWCASSYPVTSRWVMRYTYTSSSNCLTNCARGCRNAMIFNNASDTTFRTNLFNNLIEQ